MATLFHVICVYMFFLGGGSFKPINSTPNIKPHAPNTHHHTTQHNTIEQQTGCRPPVPRAAPPPPARAPRHGHHLVRFHLYLNDAILMPPFALLWCGRISIMVCVVC